MFSFREFIEGVYYLASFRGGYIEKAAPYLRWGETTGDEARYNTKVIRALLKRTLKPRVNRLGYGGYSAVGQYDLIAKDIIIDETDARREEG